MASIDNRVVSISFDNAAFQKNVEDTIKSLDALKGKLNFESASNAFSNLNKASQNVNLSSVASAVDNISSKFNAMGAIAFSILDNLTTKALSVSKNLAGSFSFTPVVGGFQEYETNMNSIQTILANTSSKGTNLKDVNAALDELNNYSDQTIYNFSEMARNIGTFTAAGVDLKTSTESIKGIANLAAVSGSSSQQASVAMYQLSQAIASGTVRLIDWNSVQNAGMGGEVFQRALFETGKTLGTIADTPIDMTFEQWTAAGNTFRGSLEDNWLTSEVLTQTLQGFTGDLTEAQLLSMGYTQAQAAEIMKMGVIAQDAATKVKTLTQLVSTTKEVLGSGWAQSFRIIVGDFEEARELFTGINNVLGDFINESANARNQLLTDWKNLGGRTKLIEGLSNAFKALVSIVRPISKAFREIFPKKTAEELFDLTSRFSEFTKNLRVGSITGERIKNVFRGIFSIFSIGIEIVTNIFNVFKRLFDIFAASSGSNILKFFSDIGLSLFSLKRELVDGNKITAFFEKLTSLLIGFVNKVNLDPIIDKIKSFKNAIVEFFGSSSEIASGGSLISGLLERISSRFESFSDSGKVFEDFFLKTKDFFEPFINLLDRFLNYVGNWFSELKQKLKDAITPSDFNNAVDAVNLGLLGAITALLTKFVTQGFKFDLGDSLYRSLDRLNGVLLSFQANLSAEALLKIAKAIALLTASVLVLSLIDSVALTKGLTALSVGFGQLIGVFAAVNQLSTGIGAAKFSGIAGGFIFLAGAILILSVAIKILSTLSWEEIAKGLTAVTGLLLGLSGALFIISKNSGGLIRAGLSILLISGAMILLGAAMKIFATMSWEDIGKGLTVILSSLLSIAVATQLMPKSLPLIAVGLVLVGAALNLIAASMKIFATMSWEDIGKGLTVLASSLILIAIATQLMPRTLPIIASGLLLVSISLLLISRVMTELSSLSWEGIAKGITSIAAVLLILAIAANTMTGAIFGAVAISIMAFSLSILSNVLLGLSKLKLSELGIALLSIVAVLAVLGLSALLLQPAIGALLLLGVALFGIGLAFAAFGLGAASIAKAFDILVKTGESGVKLFESLLNVLVTMLPLFAQQLALGLFRFAQTFLDAAPALIKSLGVLIGHILDTLVDLIPKFAQVVTLLISATITTIKALTPKIIDAGLGFIIALLSGINKKLPEIIDSGTNLIISFIRGFTKSLKEISPAVKELVAQFILELGKYAQTIIEAGADFLVKLITGIGNSANKIVEAGTNVMISFLQGISNNVQRLIDAGFAIVIDFLNGVANSIRTNRGLLLAAGFNILDAIFGGILERVKGVMAWFMNLASSVFGWIGNTASTLTSRGFDLIVGLWTGIQDRITGVTNWFKNLGSKIISWVGDLVGTLVNTGKNIIEGLWNGIYDKATNWLKGKLGWLTSLLPGWVKDALGISSPSKVFAEIGVQTMTGLMVGMNKEQGNLKVAASELANSVVDNFDPSKEDMARNLNSTIKYILDNLDSIGEFNPTITPVLDLSGARRDLTAFNGLFTTAPVSPSLSYNRAQTISEAEAQRLIATSTETIGGGDINFNQTINAPTALSTNDIYRQTRSQIAMAKKELSLL